MSNRELKSCPPAVRADDGGGEADLGAERRCAERRLRAAAWERARADGRIASRAADGRVTRPVESNSTKRSIVS